MTSKVEKILANTDFESRVLSDCKHMTKEDVLFALGAYNTRWDYTGLKHDGSIVVEEIEGEGRGHFKLVPEQPSAITLTDEEYEELLPYARLMLAAKTSYSHKVTLTVVTIILSAITIVSCICMFGAGMFWAALFTFLMVGLLGVVVSNIIDNTNKCEKVCDAVLAVCAAQLLKKRSQINTPNSERK